MRDSHRPRVVTSVLCVPVLLALWLFSSAASAQDDEAPPPPPGAEAEAPDAPDDEDAEEAKPAPKQSHAETEEKPEADKPAPEAPDVRIEKPSEPGKPGPMVLNFQRASLKEVLSYIAKKNGLAIHYVHEVEGDITLTSTETVDLDTALQMLNGDLVAKGAAAVRSGNVLKVVALTNAKKSNLPIFTGADPDQVQEGEHFITQIIPLQNVTATKIKTDLKELIPDHASLVANEDSNTLVYTASATDVKRLLRILHPLDSEVSNVGDVKIFRLENADAAQLAETLKALLNVQGQGNTGRGSSSSRGSYTNRMRQYMAYRMQRRSRGGGR